MTKRNIIILLLLAFCTILVTGCNNEAVSGDNNEEENKEKGNSSNENSSMTLTVMRGEHPAAPLKDNLPAMKEMFNKTGVQVEFDPIPGSDYNDRKNLAFGTNSITDLVHIVQSDINNHADKGIFLSITDYMEHAPNLQKLIEKYPEINRLKVDDHLYYFPFLGSWKVDAGQVPMMRVDLLEELGLDYPESFDDLYDVLKAIKEAYPDMHPLTNRFGTSYLLDTIAFPLGSGNQVYFDPDIDNGKYVYGPAREEFKEVVKYLNRLYVDGLLDPDYAINTAEMWQEKLSSGKSAFFFDNNTFAVNFNKVLQEVDENARFDLLPLMENQLGQKRAYKFHQHWLGEGYALSSKIEDPVEAIKFMDWMYSEEGIEVTNFGVLDEHYTKEDGEYIISEELLEKHANDSDPFRSMQAALGTGLLAFTVHVDERPMAATSPPELLEWKEKIISEEGYFAKPANPPFTNEEREKLTDLITKVDTLRDQELDHFILGTRSLDEYDDFIEKLREQGAAEIEDIYNNALERLDQ